jgi:hypothetical protein
MPDSAWSPDDERHSQRPFHVNEIIVAMVPKKSAMAKSLAPLSLIKTTIVLSDNLSGEDLVCVEIRLFDNLLEPRLVIDRLAINEQPLDGGAP